MGIIERTLSLLHASKSTTAFSLPEFSNSSLSSRRRTRTISSSASLSRKMTLSKLIYISLAVITLSMSPSAYSERCTPKFLLLDDFGLEDSSSASQDLSYGSQIIVREGAMFQMTCQLSVFHALKWSINNQEITPEIQDKWNMLVERDKNGTNGIISTQLTVYNASTKFHPGEYKCTPVCLYDSPGANIGIRVTVSIAINVTVNSNVSSPPDGNGNRVYKVFVPREKRTTIVCTAYVPDATMHWFRIDDGKREEDMDEVCVGPDVELSNRKTPPEHCSVTRQNREGSTVLKLEIKRVRKEGNETLKTLSDFRKYVCKVRKDNQDGSATVELVERISAIRPFEDRGQRSVSVIEGDLLEIFCDIHGVDPREFKDGRTTVTWMKDKKPLEVEESVQKISKVAEDEKGKPYRIGFFYEMSETNHRGHYTCQVRKNGESNVDVGSSGTGSVLAECTYYVRVKDKLGALWPFLGICGEVVILCTIIFIYEQRRSKAELDESDTDASPDQ